MTTRANRRLTSWIAVLALLLAALAPMVSHALSSDQAPSWIEVCTAQGSKWMVTDDGDASGSPATTHTAEHCPYCSFHSSFAGIPPSPLAAVPVPPVGEEFPPAYLAAPRRLHAWVSARPRGPPSLS